MAVFLSSIGDAAYWDNVIDSLGAAGFGILLTFVVLLVMIGILLLVHLLFAFLDKKQAAKTEQKPAADDQVEAAIVAAISEYRGDENVRINIKSIKKL